MVFWAPSLSSSNSLLLPGPAVPAQLAAGAGRRRGSSCSGRGPLGEAGALCLNPCHPRRWLICIQIDSLWRGLKSSYVHMYVYIHLCIAHTCVLVRCLGFSCLGLSVECSGSRAWGFGGSIKGPRYAKLNIQEHISVMSLLACSCLKGWCSALGACPAGLGIHRCHVFVSCGFRGQDETG